MSALFNAAADGLSRTANVPDYNAAYTVMFRFILASDLNANQIMFTLNVNATNRYDLIGTDTDGTTLIAGINNQAAGQQQNGTNLTVGTEYHLTGIRSSTSAFDLYLNAISDISTNTYDVTGRPAAGRIELANIGTANGNRFDGSISAFKFWTTNLSVSDIEQEMFHIKPQTNLSSVHVWMPMSDGDNDVIVDHGPNGYDWTEDGTVTDGPAHSSIWGGRTELILPIAAAPPTGAIMSQFQGSNLGADLYNGSIL